ncbi:MAG: DUF47 family protein [Candidatus Caldarchaeales archaeon]|jgi:uncharacterized protein Yka (UPF0111/DUF47 family)|nr:DUF47 family protein [Candidatus Caldarchaeales archaeon]
MVARSRHEEVETMLIQLAHEHVMRIAACVREFSSMISSFTSGVANADYEKCMQELSKIDNECREIRRRAEHQILSYGALLVERAEYIKLLSILDKILDKIEGAAFRAITLYKLNGFEDPITGKLSVIAEEVYEGVEGVRESFRALLLGATAVHEKLEEVEKQEREVDELYRGFDVAILQSKLKFQHVLLAREIAYLLEEIADSTEEVVNIVRAVFSLTR